MALKPKVSYSGQTGTTDSGYPWGKARNDSGVGSGDGTPLECAWVNDLFGWEQALLDAAGITPSGNPDEVGASQYLEAIEAVIALEVEAGDWTFAGEIAFESGVDFNSYVGFADEVNLSGTDQTLGMPLVSASYGRVVKRHYAIDDDEVHDFSIADADVITLPNGVQTQQRSHTLSTSGALEGDIIEFATFDTSNNVGFNGYLHSAGTGGRFATRWLYNGSAWVCIGMSYMP